MGSSRPIPPSLAGRARRVISAWEQGGLPVAEGMTFHSITCSRGYRRWPQLGTVLLRCFHLCCVPCVKAAYAACGWLPTTLANVFNSAVHSSTLCAVKSSMKVGDPIATPRWFLPSVVMTMLVSSKICSVASHCSSLITRQVLAALGW